jgi:hypothetical protein
MSNVIEASTWGADARPEDRPGVPMEQSPPHPMGNATWSIPPQEPANAAVVDPKRGITPVFGTANPPRGLSGFMRGLAYKIPTYKTERWLLLMAADRVDVLEHNPAKLAMILGGVSLTVCAFFGVRALVRR